jgi:beta-mannosidase
MEEVIPAGERHPQSRMMEHHNKQVEGPERLFRFQAAHFRLGTGFDDFIYKGQLVQAEALKTAFEHWRRRKFRTAGSLVWQLNDCWPVSSWAVVDSALRPKAAYYQVKRSFTPVLVSFRKTGTGIEVWVTNDLLKPVSGSCRITRRDVNGRLRGSTVSTVKVPANSSRKIATVGRLAEDIRPAEEYLTAELRVKGRIVPVSRIYFAEPKHLALPDANVMVRWSRGRDGSAVLRLQSDRLVRCVRLEIGGDDAGFSDNYFDLDAGRTADVAVTSRLALNELRRRLVVRWLT